MTHYELDAIFLAVWLLSIFIAFVLIFRNHIPSIETIQDMAALFNTKGGIIMFLWLAWLGTLSTTVAFGIWVIVKGVDPQHTVVTIVLGMLISQAFGNVNGALFKTMTGEEPARNGKPPDPTQPKP